MKFVGYLSKISNTYKQYPSKWVYSYPKAKKTYAEAKKAVESGKTTGTTCVVPCKWALKLMGIKQDGFHAEDGHFLGFGDDLKDNLTKKTEGGAIGYTLKQAVDKGLLKTGDILAFAGHTHTVVYSGRGYKVYDGGSCAIKAKFKTGILLDYSIVARYKNRKISSICRWK